MRKWYLAATLGVLAICALSGPAFATLGTVNLNYPGADGYYWTATVVSGDFQSGTFGTFCAEISEEAYSSGGELYTFSPPSKVIDNGGSNPNGFTPATQVYWLYDQWRNHRAGLLVSVPGATGSDLQQAIWYELGEGFSSNVPSPSDATRVSNLMSAANAAVSGGWTNDTYGILNLWSTSPIGSPQVTLTVGGVTYYAAQDILAPGSGHAVPEPVTMFSAFMAISGLGMYIRKRMKTTVDAA